MRFIKEETIYGWVNDPYRKIVTTWWHDDENEEILVERRIYAKGYIRQVEIQCKMDV